MRVVNTLRAHQQMETVGISTGTRKALKSFVSVEHLTSLLAFLLIALQFAPRVAHSQQTGIPLFSTQTGSEFDAFNIANGNIMYQLPIRSKTGPIPINVNYRGSFQLTPQLQNGGPTTYWDLVEYGAPRVVQATLQITADPIGGGGPNTEQAGSSSCDPQNPNSQSIDYYVTAMGDSTGASHPFPVGLEFNYSQCSGTVAPVYPSGWTSEQTTDGSGYTVFLIQPTNANNQSTLALFDKSGNFLINSTTFGNPTTGISVITPNGLDVTSTQTASNGVIVATNNDAYGQNVVSINTPYTPAGSGPPTYGQSTLTYAYGLGNTATITPYTSQYMFQTNFGCSYPQDGPTALATTLPSSISLPDGRAYTFGYEPTPGYPSSVTGRLAKIGLPTGGNITYTYSGGTNNTGIVCQPSLSADPAIGNGILSPVVTRTVNDGNGHSNTWTYSFSTPSASQLTNWASTTTVTDPQGNATVYSFVNGYQTEVQKYQGSAQSGSLLKTVITCYLNNFSSCANPPLTGVPFGGALYVNQTDVYTSYSGGTYSVEETHFDSNGMPTDVKEYDFGQSAPNGTGPSGTALKETQTTYGSYSGSGCTSISYPVTYGQTVQVPIYDRPCEVQVYSSGALISDTRNTYDQHGNLTKTTSMASPSWVTQLYQYNSANGALTQATDGNNNTANYGGFTCNGLLPTTITKTSANNANSMTWGESWDCDSGLMSASIAPALGSSPNSSQTISYSYNDPFFRSTNTTYPDGSQTNVCYSDVGGTCGSASATLNQVTTTVSASPSPTQTTVVTSDGLGRTLTTASPGGIYTANGYDAIGHVCATSNPSSSFAPQGGIVCGPSQTANSTSSTDGITYSFYDALNRLVLNTQQDGTTHIWNYNGNTVSYYDENYNQWNRTTDALGRLTTVVEPNGSGTSPAIETDYAYDALNNLLSVKQWGGPYGSPSADGPVQRAFYYDGISRLIAVVNPENASPTSAAAQACTGTPSGTSWTNCYGYDANGNLTSKMDNRPVTTTLSYDWLNRLVSKSYSGITALASCYQYDTGNGGLGSGAGLLGVEWTQSGGCSSPPSPTPSTGYGSLRIYDGYDLMGRPIMERQCVGGYCTSTSAPPVPSTSCSSSLTNGAGLQFCYDQAGNMLGYTNGVTLAGAGSYPQYAMTFSQSFDSAGRLNSLSSSWTDPTHPNPLFSAPEYAPFNSLFNWTLGPNLVVSRNYDTRMRVIGQSATQQ